MKKLTSLLEAFHAMLNEDTFALSEDVLKIVVEEQGYQVTENEFTIQSIERDGRISLYCQSCSDVIYDFEVYQLEKIN